MRIATKRFKLTFFNDFNFYYFDIVYTQGYVVASSSVDGTVILWDVNTGVKTDIIHQPNGESIRNMAFSPDNSIITTTDDTGLICVFGQDRILKKSIKGIHEETVPTLAFTKDSTVMLTGCTIGNIRMFFTDFEGTCFVSYF